jgi:peptidoglycan/xylan/chitin deacetylase (PgdA/CDA1 family)
MRILRRLERPRALVLLYHRVAPREAPDPYGQAVAPETFASHLEHLRRAYHVEALDRLVGQLPEGLHRDGTVAVSFDDGYADNLTRAYPIAAEQAVPMTVFVTVQPVLDRAPFWWDDLVSRLGTPLDRRRYVALHDRLRQLPDDERRGRLDALGPASEVDPEARPLTVTELQELTALPGVAVGAHTLTHPVLASLPPDGQLRELQDSRVRLEGLVGRPVELLAYPFGKRHDISRQTRRLARSAGYAAAFTSTARAITPSSPRYGLGRLSVHEWPEPEFARRVAACFRPGASVGLDRT